MARAAPRILSGMADSFGSAGVLGVPQQIEKPTKEIGALYPYGVSGFGGAALVDMDEYLPELVWPQRNYIFAEMLNDAQVDSLVNGWFYPVRQYRWSLKAGKADPARTQLLADDFGLPVLLEDGKDAVPPVRRTRTFTHAQHLIDALRAMVYGHYYFELVGEIQNDIWRITKIAARPPRTINQIKVDEHGDLTAIQQNLSLMDEPIPRSALAAYVWEREGADWFGRSVLRSLYGPWRLKQRLLNIDRIKHERNALGVPILTAKPGATPGDLSVASEMASQIRAGDSSGGALPQGYELELQGVKGTTSNPLDSVKYYDEVMARKMAQMVMMLGATASGNRALGETLEDLLDAALRTVADWYVEQTQTEIIEKYWTWNYGESDPAPTLIYDTDPELDMTTLAALATAGVIQVDDPLEDYIRDTHHLPLRAQPRGAQKTAETPPPAPVHVIAPAPSTGEPPAKPEPTKAPAIAAAAGTPLLDREGRPVLTATGHPVMIGVDGRAFSAAEPNG